MRVKTGHYESLKVELWERKLSLWIRSRGFLDSPWVFLTWLYCFRKIGIEIMKKLNFQTRLITLY